MRKFIVSALLFLMAILALGFKGYEKNIEPIKEQMLQTATVEDAAVQPGKIVIKFKGRQNFGPELSKTGIASFDALLGQYGITRLEQVMKKQPGNALLSKTSVAIASIYYAYFPESKSPVTLARELSKDPAVEYAEPLYYYRLSATPNDPQFSQQSYLNVIKATQAWDVVKGEQGNVVVAVVDGGTDINHPDLAANIWVNPNEVPNNGVDDDNNGFIDDVNGWNFANNSNDPTGLPNTPLNANHGTLVAGVIGATTNNSLGIAGTTWNATLMPINTSAQTDTFVTFGYEGVMYAASNGADVINMSWSGTVRTSFGEDVVAFAQNLGAVLVAAAGNASNAVPNYPASFPGVLSVAATDNSDIKADFSSYGAQVDLAAPGVNIISTLNGGQIGPFPFGVDGTSFSAPLVAGAVALVKTQHTDWSGAQAREQVRVSADNIDATNPGFKGRLGTGRLNLYRAVTETQLPSIRISDVSFNDTNGNGVIQPGESVEVLIKFINYLAPVSNVDIRLRSSDSFVTLTDTTETIPSLGTLAESNTASFGFNVSPIAPSGRALNFIVHISANNYVDTDRFILTVQPTFGTVAINNVDVTLTNIGRIGFANLETTLPSDGIGFKFNTGPNLLFEGAIIAGTGANRISNAARSIVSGQNLIFNKDFSPTEDGQLQINTPGLITDQESIAIFKDDKSNTPMNLRITQESFAVTAAPNNDFIILRYTVENQGQTALENFHFGLFFDWDISVNSEQDIGNNIASYDNERKLGMVSFQSTFAGVSVLTDGNISYRAIYNDPAAPGNPSWGIYDGFTDQEKWEAISGGSQFTQAGPGDVSHVIAAGPFVIQPNDYVQIGFALLGGEGSQDIRTNADAAQAFWAARIATAVEEPPDIPTTFSLEQNYPNPFNPSTTIQYEIAAASQVELAVYNLLGQKVRTLVDENRTPGIYRVQWDGKNDAGRQMASGIYLLRLIAGDFRQTQKMMLLR